MNRNNENNKTVIMAVSSDNSTKHKHIKEAQDREVSSFSHRNNNNKRKIGNKDNNNDDTTGDNEDNEIVVQQQCVIAAQTSQPQLLRWCTFHDFRLSTIQEHPSFVWLGPSSMAVYWYKEYLQTMNNKQGWIRIPKEFKKYSTTIIPQQSSHPTTAIKGTTIRTLLQCNKLKPKPQHIQKQKQNSKGNFYFIPGQYLRPDPPDGARIVVYNSDCTNISSTMMAVDNNNNNNNNNKDDSNNTIVVSTTDTTTTVTATATAACTEATNTNNTNSNTTNTTNTTTNSIRIQNILRYGVPDIHYATSYIGVYNLLRSYGRFIKISSKNNQRNNNSFNNNGNRSASSSNKRRRCNKEEGKQHQNEDADMHIVVPFDYKGPDLIIPKEQQDAVM